MPIGAKSFCFSAHQFSRLAFLAESYALKVTGMLINVGMLMGINIRPGIFNLRVGYTILLRYRREHPFTFVGWP
jgi:hypothetical protein